MKPNSFQNQISAGKIQTGAEQTRASKKLEVGSCVIEGRTASADQSQPPSALTVSGENGNSRRQLCDQLWFNNKYKKCQSPCKSVEECICWQGRCTCLDHRTIKKMTSDETVDSFINLFVSNLPRRKNCSYVEHAVAYWITERQKLHMCVMKVFLHKPGKVTREKLKSWSLSWSFFVLD